MANPPDIIPEQVELRPALSSTGDVPRFLSELQQASEAPSEPSEPTNEPNEPNEPTEPTEPAEPTEAPPAEPVEPPAEAKPDPRTVRIREAEARADRLADMVEKLVGTLQQRQEPPPPPAPEPPAIPTVPESQAAPRRSDFDDPDAYDAAFAAWNRAEARREIIAEQAAAAKIAAEKAEADRQTQAQKTAEEQQAAVERTYLDRRAKFVETHADYAQVVERDDLHISQGMGEMIKHAEDGPAIAYWLGQNPSESDRIAKIQAPALIFYEMGKISAQLASASAPPPPKPRTAPPPIRTVGDRAAATERDLYDVGNEGSMEEYAARRMAMPDMKRTSSGFRIQ